MFGKPLVLSIKNDNSLESQRHEGLETSAIMDGELSASVRRKLMSFPQVIETEYKGYRFRSRLEARWAVFFDTLTRSNEE